MKTKATLISALLVITTILSSGGNVYRSSNRVDTLALNNKMILMPALEEESYVDDIPFDTRTVALNTLYAGLQKPEPEAYIDDIPFNTAKIAAAYTYAQKIVTKEEEKNVNDIPFSTREVVNNYIMNSYGLAARSYMKTRCEE